MDNNWIERWDSRYSAKEYAYGETPNEYFKQQILKLPIGKILLPAEGEGRNAVYAAQLGWEVYAFDISQEGKNKAMALAHKLGVSITYEVGTIEEISVWQHQFDAIALIYAHFPAAIKSNYHKQLLKGLKKGGKVIFEAFSKKHLAYNTTNKNVGGPKDIESLFSVEEVQNDFDTCVFTELTETEIFLQEGSCHVGKGSVIRFVAQQQR